LPGIPESQLASVFDRFSGGDLPRSDTRNFGLGLSIVRAVAEAHGGRATAAQGPRGGAAVTLWLPLYDLADGTVRADEASPASAVPHPVEPGLPT
jgi:signal transduction histidine kinase